MVFKWFAKSRAYNFNTRLPDCPIFKGSVYKWYLYLNNSVLRYPDDILTGQVKSNLGDQTNHIQITIRPKYDTTTSNYSGDLKSKLVQYSNGPKEFNC